MSEPTMQDLKIQIAEIEKDIKGIWKRIDEQLQLATSVNELATKVEVQGHRLNDLVGKLSELVEDIKEMKAKPARRWETVVSQVIGLIVAALFGVIIAKLGL